MLLLANALVAEDKNELRVWSNFSKNFARNYGKRHFLAKKIFFLTQKVLYV